MKQQLLEEGEQPESCFTQEALKLLEQRRNNLVSLSRQLSNLALLDNSPLQETPTKDTKLNYEEKFGNLVKDNSNNNEEIGNKENDSSNSMLVTTSASVTAEDLDISQLQPTGHVNHSDQVHIFNTCK